MWPVSRCRLPAWDVAGVPVSPARLGCGRCTVAARPPGMWPVYRCRSPTWDVAGVPLPLAHLGCGRCPGAARPPGMWPVSRCRLPAWDVAGVPVSPARLERGQWEQRANEPSSVVTCKQYGYRGGNKWLNITSLWCPRELDSTSSNC
ncbi:hypothetical protein BsWGS_06156 [Bradybaena similaris]